MWKTILNFGNFGLTTMSNIWGFFSDRFDWRATILSNAMNAVTHLYLSVKNRLVINTDIDRGIRDHQENAFITSAVTNWGRAALGIACNVGTAVAEYHYIEDETNIAARNVGIACIVGSTATCLFQLYHASRLRSLAGEPATLKELTEVTGGVTEEYVALQENLRTLEETNATLTTDKENLILEQDQLRETLVEERENMDRVREDYTAEIEELKREIAQLRSRDTEETTDSTIGINYSGTENIRKL